MLLHGDGYHFLSFPVTQRCRHARNTSNPLIQDTFTRSWSWLASKHINPKFRPENRADNALENQRQQNHWDRNPWIISLHLRPATCHLKLIEIKIHLESQRQRPSSRAHTSDAKTSFSISSTLQVSHVPDVPGSVKYFFWEFCSMEPRKQPTFSLSAIPHQAARLALLAGAIPPPSEEKGTNNAVV